VKDYFGEDFDKVAHLVRVSQISQHPNWIRQHKDRRSPQQRKSDRAGLKILLSTGRTYSVVELKASLGYNTVGDVEFDLEVLGEQESKNLKRRHSRDEATIKKDRDMIFAYLKNHPKEIAPDGVTMRDIIEHFRRNDWDVRNDVMLDPRLRNHKNLRIRPRRKSKKSPVDSSMADKGGIDLTTVAQDVETRGSVDAARFEFDADMLEALNKAEGIDPVIVNTRSVTTPLPEFLAQWGKN
jgi:hypothetical protein